MISGVLSGKKHIFTKNECEILYGTTLEKPSCYLCGKHFKENDIGRFVYSEKGNFFVCEQCDCEEVEKKYENKIRELKEIFNNNIWFFQRYMDPILLEKREKENRKKRDLKSGDY